MKRINRTIYTAVIAGGLLSSLWIIFSEAILSNLGFDPLWRPVLLIAGIGALQTTVILFSKNYYEKKTGIKINHLN